MKLSALSPAVFEALSALALHRGLRVSARELGAQSAVFEEAAMHLLSAVDTLQRLGLPVQLGQVSPAGFDAARGPLVVGQGDDGALLLLGRQGSQLQVWRAGSGTELLPQEQVQQHWSGWSVQAGHAPASLEEETAPEHAPHWFWSVFGGLRGHYLDCAVAAVLINLLALASSMFSMNVYDRVVPNAALHSLWVLAVGVTLAGLLELGLRTLRGYLVDVAGKKADLLLSARLFRQILNLRAQDRPGSSGQFASQVRDFESVRDFVSSSTLVALTDLPFAVLFLVVIALMGGPLAWVPVVAALVVLCASALSQWPVRQSIERYQYESAQKQGFMVEALERLEQLRALGAEPLVQSRWERLSAVTARSAMGSRLASAVTVNFTQFVQQTCNTAMIVWGVYLILEGRMSVGALIGCTILAGRVLGPLGQVAGLVTRYQHALGAYKAMDRIMALQGQFEAHRTYLGLARAQGALSLQQMRFAYPQAPRPALDIAGLDIPAGSRVAIMGPVGSGKSTLLRVLAGLLWPTGGQVLLDGLDMAHISPADLRAQIAWVGQDAVLFRGSLRDNLLMGAPQAPDARLQQVLQTTGITAWVAAHPMGLDMPLGEGGAMLSGGQRQMVALARALLADAPVLLLDEPSSALDASTEQSLIEALRPQLAGKTLVVATHRPGPLALADRLVLLDGGQLLADGPRDAVLQAVREGRVRRAPAAQPMSGGAA